MFYKNYQYFPMYSLKLVKLSNKSMYPEPEIETDKVIK